MQAAEDELRAIMDVLKQKQKQLTDIEKKIKKLQNEYDEAVNNLANLEYNIQLSEARLNRSGRLTSALADEEIRWQQNMKVRENRTLIIILIFVLFDFIILIS